MTSGATEATGFARWLALAFATVGSAVNLAFFMFVDLGGTVSGMIHPLSPVAAAIWAGPFWIYAFLVRTRAGALIGGAGLLAATAGFLVAMFRSTGSTAGIGIFTLPMLLYPLAAALLAMDRLLSGWRSGEEQLLRTLVRRIIAVGLCFVVLVAGVRTVFGIASLFHPSSRPDLAASLILTATSAAITIAGAIAVPRLWRRPARAIGPGATKP